MRWLLEDKRIVLSLGLMALTAALSPPDSRDQGERWVSIFRSDGY